MAYSKSYDIDVSITGDYIYDAIVKLEADIDQIITDLNECHLTTQGDILYRGGSSTTRLPIGTAYQLLQTNSGATAPQWTSQPTQDWVVKGWVRIDGSDGSTRDSFNVSATSKLACGNGRYQVNWDTDFGDTNYCPIPFATGTTTPRIAHLITASIAAGVTVVYCTDHAGAATDATELCVIAIGDQ